MWTYIDEQKDVLTNILNQEEKILSSLPDAFINNILIEMVFLLESNNLFPFLTLFSLALLH